MYNTAPVGFHDGMGVNQRIIIAVGRVSFVISLSYRDLPPLTTTLYNPTLTWLLTLPLHAIPSLRLPPQHRTNTSSCSLVPHPSIPPCTPSYNYQASNYRMAPDRKINIGSTIKNSTRAKRETRLTYSVIHPEASSLYICRGILNQ